MDKESRQIVMIVDDSIVMCRQIKTALENMPAFICEAHSGQEAIELAEQYQPDLILLDVVLPDIEGYDLFGKLKAIDRNDAVIMFLTSKDKGEDVVKGFSLGAFDYIKKPFAQGELYSRVNTHLQLKRKTDELNRQNKELLSNVEKLNYMAFRDGLTGLYNRRYVIRELMEDIQEHATTKGKTVFILADIDDFKMINDTYGHDAGDMTLISIAKLLDGFLDGLCRKHRVIRWGGEEFLIVLFAATEDDAYHISEQVRKKVAELTFPFEGGSFSCTITLGLHIHQEDDSFKETIKCADKALYQGKRNGKNRSVWYNDVVE